MAKKKAFNLLELVLKCRKFAISKDKTRPYLQGVYFDKDEKRSVTTNGYVMSVSKILYQEELGGLLLDSDFTVFKREFPKWQSVIPSKFNDECFYEIEERFFIKSKKPEDRKVFFYKDGTLSLEEKEGYLFALDSFYLEPLKGLKLYFKSNNALSPVTVQLSEDYREEIFIIMPIKV